MTTEPDSWRSLGECLQSGLDTAGFSTRDHGIDLSNVPFIAPTPTTQSPSDASRFQPMCLKHTPAPPEAITMIMREAVVRTALKEFASGGSREGRKGSLSSILSPKTLSPIQ